MMILPNCIEARKVWASLTVDAAKAKRGRLGFLPLHVALSTVRPTAFQQIWPSELNAKVNTQSNMDMQGY
jgi:hypothetical protein